jgi:hypothetical protein
LPVLGHVSIIIYGIGQQFQLNDLELLIVVAARRVAGVSAEAYVAVEMVLGVNRVGLALGG